ncbi:MAG: AMP-binding protein [Acidimicrobiia bacterium]
MALVAFGELISQHAASAPDLPAITVGERTLSRAELDRVTNQVARRYAEQGAHEGTIVVTALANSVELIVSCIATWKLGATPLVIASKMPPAERGPLMELVQPSLLIEQPDQVAADGHSAAPLTSKVATWWRASTSGGSTGRPKLVLSKAPGVHDPESRALRLRPGGCVMVPGPLYHGAPFLATFHGLFRGKHAVLLERFDPEATLMEIAHHRADYLLVVPTMMSRISKLPRSVRDAHDLSSLECVLSLGASCPEWLKQDWIDWLGPERIYELYAGTEGQATTWIRGDEWLTHRGSVGRAVGGAVMAAFGPDMVQLPPGELGEIFMLPPSEQAPTYEYVGAEVRSHGRWESLGDMGWVDADGYVYIADRRTDMIVTGGSNVYPAEVENALEAHPLVRTAVVIGLPDDDLGHRVHAIVEVESAHSQEEMTQDDLAVFLAERLVRYKIPRTFEIVTEPLRDEAGKVRRSLLREQRM